MLAQFIKYLRGGVMADRNNIDDIFNIVKEDFNWIVEDITQHRSLIKEEFIKAVQVDKFDDMDDYKQKCEDLEMIIEKIENVKQEYTSLITEDSTITEEKIMGDGYDELEDWKDTIPEELLLFGKAYMVRTWRDILLTLLEDLLNRNRDFINGLDKMDEFKGRTRIYFSYDKDLINDKFYKQLSNNMFVLVNDNANTIHALCRRLLEVGGYSYDVMKIKLRTEDKPGGNKIGKIETDKYGNMIKLSPRYQSVTIDKELFKKIVHNIINWEKEYNIEYFEPRKLEEKLKNLILSQTKYTIAYHVIINIVKYLKDSRFIDHYRDSKKGKYVVIDENALTVWLENNLN